MTLPPIREWWPHLSTDARRDLLESGSPHLVETVRDEIREITGAVVGQQESLSAEDAEYVRSRVDED